MKQMYEVFCENRCLFLTSVNGHTSDLLLQTPIIQHSYATNEMVQRWLHHTTELDIAIDSELLPGEFLSKHIPGLVFVKAAGGIVRNSKGDFLFIYKNKKWDLPKGHIEVNELPHATALRELTEETGLQHVEIQRFVGSTFHCYNQHNTWFLKETHWFDMSVSQNSVLVPDLQEGISHLEWIDCHQVEQVLHQSYRSLREFVTHHYLSHS